MTTTTSGREAASSSHSITRERSPGSVPIASIPPAAAIISGHPVPGRVDRVEPLERGDPGSPAGVGRAPDGVDAARQRGVEVLARAGPAAGVAEPERVGEDLAEGRGVQRQHPRFRRQASGDRPNVVVADRAHLADLPG